ncbi:hypothetical protein E4T39_04572 [Aureobasidium subglaciale]|nr:hypothetical protein E4T39_04572 [Aureobasidium subglaciale]
MIYQLLPLLQDTPDFLSGKGAVDDDTTSPSKNQRLHLLLPTTAGDTILSAKALGYPEPVILGWGDVFDTWYLLAGGSHLAKISRVNEYLESMAPEQDNDLVMMMDAFDIWFQLPPKTLIDRYYAVNAKANKRISKHMGKAAELEHINQTIIFGAGKRCAPNQPHTVGCYPVPMSPVSEDVYGANTDTIMGRNKYTSNRQRYLNSGYIIGPVKDMRFMFQAAWQKVQDWPEEDPNDNGSGGSGFGYHASDQAVFAVMFGEQQFQREVMRRRHASTWTSQYKRMMKKSPVNKIEGTEVPDILDPPFTHEAMEPFEGRPYEYGIGIDYFSDLGHQTANSEWDGMWLRYDDSSEVFLDKTREERNDFDCKYRSDQEVPSDMKTYDETQFLPEQRRWEQINLYTHLCMGTIPVMAHFNGDKTARERQWSLFWVQKCGKWIVENTERLGGGRIGASMWKKDEQTQFLSWDTLCPPEYSQELFRGSELAIA